MLKEGDAESGLSTDNSVYRKGNKQHPTGNVDVLFKHQGICFFTEKTSVRLTAKSQTLMTTICTDASVR